MKKYKTFYENTILENIDLEGYGYSNKLPLYDKINVLYIAFKREYLHENNKHLGEIFLFSEWLRGLPSLCTVPFYNFEILQNGLKAGFDLSNEDKEDLFLENYWTLLSKAFFTLKNNL